MLRKHFCWKSCALIVMFQSLTRSLGTCLRWDLCSLIQLCSVDYGNDLHKLQVDCRSHLVIYHHLKFPVFLHLGRMLLWPSGLCFVFSLNTNGQLCFPNEDLIRCLVLLMWLDQSTLKTQCLAVCAFKLLPGGQF